MQVFPFILGKDGYQHISISLVHQQRPAKGDVSRVNILNLHQAVQRVSLALFSILLLARRRSPNCLFRLHQ
ncbi:hypothetical protein PEC301899_27940 [Pectobacterium carotovorum subsp. carotovorum]|nr:hypothetical protein PEC301899_27940 [Pectobacterium carotovorum subsp. carotovorum]